MKPESISEQMMYNTIRLETELGCGMGSYSNFKMGDYVVPVIITNKHVINYKEHEKVTFFAFKFSSQINDTRAVHSCFR